VVGFVRTVAVFVSTDEEAISELQAFEGDIQGKKSRGAPLTALCPGFEPDRIEVLFYCIQLYRLSQFQI
jgi:hypothetical protein